MDLKSFITDTLVQIVEGVEAARETIAKGPTNAQINPAYRAHSENYKGSDIRPVEFDVAVTAAQEGGASGKFSVAVAALNLGFDAGGKLSTETVSRIKFSVHLAQPGEVEVQQRSSFQPLPTAGWKGN
jgi:hypothetical protein